MFIYVNGIFSIIVIVTNISSEASGPIMAGSKASPAVTSNVLVTLETNLQGPLKL